MLRKLFVLVALLSILVLSGCQKVPCNVVYEGGKKIADNCEYPQFCNADVSIYDDNVRSGQRVEASGTCNTPKKGPGTIGP